MKNVDKIEGLEHAPNRLSSNKRPSENGSLLAWLTCEGEIVDLRLTIEIFAGNAQRKRSQNDDNARE